MTLNTAFEALFIHQTSKYHFSSSFIKCSCCCVAGSESSSSSSSEEDSEEEGEEDSKEEEWLDALNKRKKHPYRLHDDLWYNDQGEVRVILHTSLCTVTTIVNVYCLSYFMFINDYIIWI